MASGRNPSNGAVASGTAAVLGSAPRHGGGRSSCHRRAGHGTAGTRLVATFRPDAGGRHAVGAPGVV